MVTIELKETGVKFPEYIEGFKSLKEFVEANPIDGWEKRVISIKTPTKTFRQVEYFTPILNQHDEVVGEKKIRLY